MSSKIKVDTIENVAGSGNVSLGSGHNLVVPGTVSITGETTLATHLNMGDNDKIKLGASADLQIYHDGSNSYIKENGIGNLYLQGSNHIFLTNSDGSKTYAGFNSPTGWAKLYYDNAEKLATTSVGATISGILRVDAGTAAAPTLAFTNDTDTGLFSAAANQLGFTTAGTETMRISGDNFMIGKTVGNFTTAGSIQQKSGADGSPSYFYQIKTYSGTRNSYLNYHNGTYVGGINMTNTSTSFPTSSDERLKKNIKDAPSGGDKIDAMKVRSFNWKVDDSLQEYGLIAQELEPIYAWPVETLDNGDAYTIDYTKLVPIMLKEIQDLRKRVATLESS